MGGQPSLRVPWNRSGRAAVRHSRSGPGRAGRRGRRLEDDPADLAGYDHRQTLRVHLRFRRRLAPYDRRGVAGRAGAEHRLSATRGSGRPVPVRGLRRPMGLRGELRVALADTSHPRHDDMVEWTGEDIDPLAFDPVAPVAAVAVLAKRWWRKRRAPKRPRHGPGNARPVGRVRNSVAERTAPCRSGNRRADRDGGAARRAAGRCRRRSSMAAPRRSGGWPNRRTGSPDSWPQPELPS